MKSTLLILFTLFTTLLFAQEYKSEWERVINLETEGKIKSAAAVVDVIYNKASVAKNEPQLIKAFFFRSKYMQVLDLEAQVKIINLIKEEKKKVSAPTEAIMESLYAEMLQSIFDKNRYKIRERTATDAPTPENFLEWNENDFKKEIRAAYNRSIRNKELLYKIPVTDYEAIIDFDPALMHIQRPLLDILAERYCNGLDQYNNDYWIEENSSLLYGNVQEFAKYIIKNEHPLADCLKMQREIEKLYTDRNDTYNLQRAVLRRLEWISRVEHSSNRKHIYTETLYKFANEWDNSPFAWRAKLKAAALLTETADKIKTPYAYIKAMGLCNDIINNQADMALANLAKAIKQAIESAKATIITERHITAEKPFLALINFRNIDSVRVNIYKANTNFKNRGLYLEYLKSKKPLESLKIKLPKKEDYFEYSTETLLPALPSGHYSLVLLPVSGDVETGIQELADVHVSEIALLAQNDEKGSVYQIVKRDSGKPVKNVFTVHKGKKYASGKNGIITIPHDKEKNAVLKFIYKTDTLTSNHSGYYAWEKDVVAKAQIYLDRPIYRPGQKVYFKGIVTVEKEGVVTTVPNEYVTVYVEDPNDNEIVNLRLQTNEFGSVAGEFDLPQLTGSYTITIDEDQKSLKTMSRFYEDIQRFEEARHYIKVEEYKRPTFEVGFDKVEDDIKLGAKSFVTGTAKTFSGVPVQNAIVRYSITRDSRKANRDFYEQGSNNHIISGETITDTEGKFRIDFEAVGDNALKAEDLPLLTFRIAADVTDIAGETRSSNVAVNAGYHSLVILAIVSSELNTSNAGNSIKINTQNLNGKDKPATVTVKVYKLHEDEKFLKVRSWSVPDIQTIPENEFKKYFPYLQYRQSNEPADKRINVVYTTAINTANDHEIKLPDIEKWISGKYEAVFTAKDETGYEVEQRNYFNVKQDHDPAGDVQNPLEVKIVNKDFIKDGHVSLKLRSQLPSIYVNITALYQGKTVYNKNIQYKGDDYLVKIPVSLKTGRGLGIKVDYLWENQYYSVTENVILSELPKLKITTETLSDKIAPGSSQAWSFTIESGLPAEVLASMYDVSLNKFNVDDWRSVYTPSNYNDYHIPYKYFQKNNVYFGYNNYKPIDIRYQDTDGFFMFGFDINQSYNIYSAKPKSRLKRKGDILYYGTVSDNSGPLPGAGVFVAGTMDGVATDIDGRFAIYATQGEKLEIAYLGFKEQTIILGAQNNIAIIMQESMGKIESVKLDAYRRTPATNAPLATSADRYNTSVLSSLQGQFAGLNVTYGSGQPGSNDMIILRGTSSLNNAPLPLIIIDGVPISEEDFHNINPNDIENLTVVKGNAAAIYGNRGANGVIVIKTKQAEKERIALQQIQGRKNFNETAFFYPQLYTDEKGKIKFTFTTPEALTEWKLRLQAHNKKAESGYFETALYTQKDLMIVPNMPRFLRERDTVVIKARITNLTTEAKSGNAMLQLFDAKDMRAVDAEMLNAEAMKPFTIPAKGSVSVSWTITVPAGLEGVQYKVVAMAGNFSDGEENILPVLTNRMLITESLPVWVKPQTKRQYTFENLKNTSHTLKNHAITIEYTSNPAWLALQSLPYLMEYEHDCAEQVFARFYANSIGTHIINSNPKIAEVFAAWKEKGQPSKMEQNQELKSILLAETPWVLDGQTEEEKKNRMALLFDINKMKGSLRADLVKLDQKQLPSGGFPWFSGGIENDFITRHVVAGLGHLNQLGIAVDSDANHIIKGAVGFIDKQFLSSYRQNEVSKKRIELFDSYSSLHYLYARSFHIKKYPMETTLKNAVLYYVNQLKDNWKNLSLYQKGMAALVLHRFNESATAKNILIHLRETSASNEEWGMHWVENKPGWWWHTAPVETQALLIEAFTEIDNDMLSADAMKAWLIKSKQDKNWPTTKSTSEAVYALLMKGSDWLSVKENTDITLGTGKTVEAKINESNAEAGTGYVKLRWNEREITKDMAVLTVENKSAVPGFGGFYWQYFEDLEKIKPAQKAVMNVNKQLFVKANTSKGITLQPLDATNTLKLGDLVTVRMVLEIKEDVEYVHLKDLRAAAFEPVDVISKYEWKDGLGYYYSTRDAATHFFFDKINKGTYFLQYDVRVNNSGNYSNGITTIQSMYAPEFSGHTAGIRVKAE